MLSAWPYSQFSEAELVKQAQAHDNAAFEELVCRYDVRICTYLARMVGDDEAGRDLAQETFLKGWQALPRLVGEVRFQPWLYKIATNAARDYLRRKRLIAWLPWKDDLVRGDKGPWVPGPEGRTEMQEVLTFALKQVPLKYSQCVFLQIVEERSQREIAQLLGISETSVSTYVHRGLEKLRQIYVQPEHEHEMPKRRKGVL